MFIPPLPNIQLLQSEVITATKRPGARLIWRHCSCWPSLSRPAMKIEIMPPGNYLQHSAVCTETQIFSDPFISKDDISLQPPSWIRVDRSAWPGEPINHSLGNNIHIHLMYLTWDALLLLLISECFRILGTLMSYIHFKYVIKLNEFDYSQT
jgi:hypothetical protein